MIHSTEDLVLVIGACAGAFTGCMAAIKLSRCTRINICYGCLDITRSIKGVPPTEDAAVQV